MKMYDVLLGDKILRFSSLKESKQAVIDFYRNKCIEISEYFDLFDSKIVETKND